MDGVKERTKVMDILILIITVLIILNLIGDNFINGFKESQAKSYIVAANNMVEKVKSNKSNAINDLEEGSSIKVSICDVTNETSPYNSSKYVCDYSYVVVTRASNQLVYKVQLLDEKGNAIPLNNKSVLNYKQVKNRVNKSDLHSIND